MIQMEPISKIFQQSSELAKILQRTTFFENSLIFSKLVTERI